MLLRTTWECCYLCFVFCAQQVEGRCDDGLVKKASHLHTISHLQCPALHTTSTLLGDDSDCFPEGFRKLCVETMRALRGHTLIPLKPLRGTPKGHTLTPLRGHHPLTPLRGHTLTYRARHALTSDCSKHPPSNTSSKWFSITKAAAAPLRSPLVVTVRRNSSA